MTSPRPLLFVDHATGLGGAEHSLLLLLAHLDRTRWALHLACPPGLLADRASALGVAAHHQPLPRLRRSPRLPVDWLAQSRALAQLAHRLNAGAIISNTVRATVYCAPAARLARRPHVWIMRDFWLGESAPRHPALDTLLKRLLVLNAGCVIANSHATASHLPASPRLHVIHNGIDLKQYATQGDGQAVRQRYGIPAAAPLFGMVGRLRPWKGQRLFLQAAAGVMAELPAAHALIVGGAPLGEDTRYAAALVELAAGLGIADRVHFTGHLADVRDALAALDLFVHPGAPEPFGLVNIEALAAGVPVVAFAHGALPEIVQDGVSGVLVTPNDTAQLTAAIVALLRDPQRRAALAVAGRLRAAEFDIARTVARVDAVLQTVVNS